VRRALWAAAALLLALPGAAAAQGGGGVERTAQGVQIDFQGTDMRLAVAALAEAAGLNVVFGELPSRPVTLRTGAPVPPSMLRSYLESLLRANGLNLVDEGGGLLRVVSAQGAGEGQQQPVQGSVQRGPPGEMRVWVHRLRHAPAEDIARSVGALFGIGDRGGAGAPGEVRSLSEELRTGRYGTTEEGARPTDRSVSAQLQGGVQIVPDPRTNALLIRATAADYETIRAAVDELDTRPLQVLIEVLIAEVRRDRQFGLGVDVRIPEQLEPRSGATIGGELSGGSAGDVVLRVMRLGAVRAEVVLRALAASGEVTILSRPVILAQNNEQARILVGDERPFIQISRALPTDGAVRDQVVQYRDVGTQLTIRPTINPDGYVTMSVLQEVNTATAETQFGAPVISTREAETRLLVKDGNTVVIGGLVDQQRTTANTGIPFLRDIPVLGNLFRSTQRRNTTTELFLFLIPHVLRTDEDVEEATARVRQRAPRLDRALGDSIPLLWEPADSAATRRAPATPAAPATQAPATTPAQPAPRTPANPGQRPPGLPERFIPRTTPPPRPPAPTPAPTPPGPEPR
jgi:general secretion pathway protein D